jgi:methionyl-tRNA formyltransferase
MKTNTLVMLAGPGKPTHILYHALKNDFSIETVVMEEPVPRTEFLRRRIQRLGFFKVLGQILFQIGVVPYLRRISRKRILELMEEFKLNDEPIDEVKITRVRSVNSDETMGILKEIHPSVVVISGTRIISDKVLNCVPSKFLNIHAGITPRYRGVHGAYWALVENNPKACGVTVHLVDPGIDTGNILEQQVVEPTEKDNFVTYPLLQLATGIPLLKKAIHEIFENQMEIKPYPDGRSRLWSHPTLLEYLWYRIYRGVK